MPNTYINYINGNNNIINSKNEKKKIVKLPSSNLMLESDKVWQEDLKTLSDSETLQSHQIPKMENWKLPKLPFFGENKEEKIVDPTATTISSDMSVDDIINYSKLL
jgi:Tat protein secretion system quality control protein TatD with DNase activity